MALKFHNKKALIYELFTAQKTVKSYKQRNFAKSRSLSVESYQLQTYQHIKKPLQCSYLVFDIDVVDDKNFINIFYNNFSLLPNFYIYEYSKNKNCYTLQVFFLMDSKIKIDDKFLTMYKKISQFFGADKNYQLKTGIHKNPTLEKYDYLEQFEDIKLINSDYVCKIHNNKHLLNQRWYLLKT